MHADGEHAAREIRFASSPRSASASQQQARPAGDPDAGREQRRRRASGAEQRVFCLAAGDLARLQRSVALLSGRAARLGLEPVSLIDTGRRDRHGRVLVRLCGRAPVLAGWRLCAIVDHRTSPPTVRPVDNHTPPTVGGAVCEHCGLRRRRTRTFVVENERTGERRQIGSGCLRDFLGGADPALACRHAEQLASIREQLADAEPGGDREPQVSEWAAHAARVIRAHGWRPASQPRGQPSTVQRTRQSEALGPGAPSVSDRALAHGALTWTRTLLDDPGTPASPFEREAAAVARAGGPLDRRGQGLVCALVGVYRQRRARSTHLGTPGEAITLTALVERVSARSSARYGQVACCELIDRHVNRLVWFQTRGPALAPGQVVTLSGQVDRHDYRGRSAITVLTRCRVVTRA